MSLHSLKPILFSIQNLAFLFAALHLLGSATKRERERERERERVPICLLRYLACSLRIGHHSVPFDALIKCHVLFLQENHRIMALPTTLE